MTRVEMLRALMNERLTAVVEEICGLFETTIAEYEKKVSHSKEEIEQQRRLLNAVISNGVKLHNADIPQVLVIQQEMQEWRSNLDQNAPESLYIKEEQEELWSSQEGQYLEGPEKSPFPGAPVKGDSQKGQQQSYPSILNDIQQVLCTEQTLSEQREQRPTLKHEEPRPPHIEKDQETPRRSLNKEQKGAEENREAESPDNSSAQQMETGGADCEGAEPALQSHSEKTSNSSDCETEDSDDDWKRMPRQQSNFKLIKDAQVPKLVPNSDLKPVSDLQSASDIQPANEYKTLDSSEPETEDSDDDWKHSRKTQSGLPTEKPKEVPESSSKFSCHTEKRSCNCSVCGKRFHLEQQLRKHTKIHSQATFTCSECGKHFSHMANLSEHMRTHSADKMLNGSVSKKCEDSASLKRHKTKQLEEKSFPCSICDKIFEKKTYLVLHMKRHKVESKHTRTHTGGNS